MDKWCVVALCRLFETWKLDQRLGEKNLPNELNEIQSVVVSSKTDKRLIELWATHGHCGNLTGSRYYR